MGNDFYSSGSIWTIAVEFQFYLIFPLISLFLNRYGIRYFVGLVILMIATRFNIAILKDGDIYYNEYITIVGRLEQFIVGMVLGYYYQKDIFNFLAKWRYHYFVSNYHSSIYLSFTFEAILWGIITLCYLHIQLPPTKKLNTVFSYLGMCSFFMYLLHLPIGNMLNDLIGWQQPQDVLTSLFQSTIRTCVIVLVSFFTLNLIEKTFIQMRKNI